MPVTVGNYRAPINYDENRRAFNLVRIVAAAVVATASVVAIIWGLESAPFVLAASLVVAGDGMYRIRHATPAFPLLLVDVTAIGFALLVRGSTPSAEVSAFLYVVAASMLLLPLIWAGLAIVYALAWVPILITYAPLVEESGRSVLQAQILDRIAMLVFVIVIGLLLYVAGREVHAASRRHTEALDAERRAVELRNEFVSMVSHELRTPLTSIAGFTDHLQENWKSLDGEEIAEFLSIMRREEAHLRNLVEDILVIPRLEAGQLRLEPQSIPLRTEAYEVSRLVFAGTRREVQVDIPVDVVVVADPHRLRQIFRNLLENARKYGGDQVLIAGERTGPSYKVVIADNGPGIPVEDRTRIFEHFEQAVKGDARSEGVGLGLPIARKLARAMGGDLWFEPRFPTGAQFLFTVTTAEESDSSDRPAPPADNITPMRRTGT